ncbi:penicillin-binding protein activator [Altererythrobacter sp. ZODW24]|uniref:penicillin-binding protein activator n=1 Tax=Altererythrobacter sp. ZODW24 TaxID=2185142 RepID=UPI001F074121|nr:penicillin-binding protein activator [Altererythrobacter sp. ZODW24]
MIPRGAGPAPVEPAPAPAPTPVFEPEVLPQDQQRHRVALLVPLSGRNGGVGQAIANATTMALLDTNAANLRITTYDTATRPRDAARRAMADDNTLVLGPLLAENIPSVMAETRAAGVPIISYSNDTKASAAGVYLLGQVPGQSIDRTVEYASKKGATRFAALVPTGDYGNGAEAAFRAAAAKHGGSLVTVERYARGNTSIVGAAQRLKTRGGFDSVLIADGARLSANAAAQLKPGGRGDIQLIGTELWSGDSAVTRASAMSGSIFSAVSDERYRQFSESYRTRFGSAPYRISTLGYDSVLLALRVASKGWEPGESFPTSEMVDRSGFLGLDGPFRFNLNGIAERSMEIREVRRGSVVIVDAAPSRFED